MTYKHCVDLIRVSSSVDFTIGSLGINGVPVCWSLELPWRNNEREVSCIPEGSYSAKKERHHKFGDVLRISGVPERDGILVHIGNYLKDTRGCILPGIQLGNLHDGGVEVLSSTRAMAKLYELLPDNQSFPFAVIDGFCGIVDNR